MILANVGAIIVVILQANLGELARIPGDRRRDAPAAVAFGIDANDAIVLNPSDSLEEGQPVNLEKAGNRS